MSVSRKSSARITSAGTRPSSRQNSAKKRAVVQVWEGADASKHREDMAAAIRAGLIIPKSRPPSGKKQELSPGKRDFAFGGTFVEKGSKYVPLRPSTAGSVKSSRQARANSISVERPRTTTNVSPVKHADTAGLPPRVAASRSSRSAPVPGLSMTATQQAQGTCTTATSSRHTGRVAQKPLSDNACTSPSVTTGERRAGRDSPEQASTFLTQATELSGASGGELIKSSSASTGRSNSKGETQPDIKEGRQKPATPAGRGDGAKKCGPTDPVWERLFHARPSSELPSRDAGTRELADMAWRELTNSRHDAAAKERLTHPTFRKEGGKPRRTGGEPQDAASGHSGASVMRSTSNEERGSALSQRGAKPVVPQLQLSLHSDRAPAEPRGETSVQLQGTPRAITRSSRSNRFTVRSNVIDTTDLMSGNAGTVQGMDAPQASSAPPGAARRQHSQEDEAAKAGHPARALGKARPAAGRWGIKPHSASTIDSFQVTQMAMSEDTDGAGREGPKECTEPSNELVTSTGMPSGPMLSSGLSAACHPKGHHVELKQLQFPELGDSGASWREVSPKLEQTAMGAVKMNGRTHTPLGRGHASIHSTLSRGRR